MQKVAEPVREAVAAINALRQTSPVANFRALSTELVHVNDAGHIQIYVILTEFLPEHVSQLSALGLEVEVTLPESRLVQGWMPASILDRLAELGFVAEVKPPGYPVWPRSH